MDERPQDLSRADHRSGVSGPSFRMFLGMSNKLNLSTEDRCSLLGITCDEYDFYTDTFSEPHSAAHLATLSREQLERIAVVMEIFRALRTLFADDSSAIAWLKSANRDTVFCGETPLAVACSGIDGLHIVRRYINAWRNGY